MLALRMAAPDQAHVRFVVDAMAHGGEGVGRGTDDARVCFVRDTVVGDEVEVVVEREAKRFRRGRVANLLRASPHRVDPPCRLAATCGGCSWQHVAEADQAALKLAIVAGQLRNLPIVPQRVVASPNARGYRRRARAHYVRTREGLVFGFHRAHSREVVDVDHCLVLRDELDRALQKIRLLAPHLPREGEVHGLSDGTRVVLGLPGVAPRPEIVRACEAVLDGEEGPLVGISLRGARKRAVVGRAELVLDVGQFPGVYTGPFAFAQAQAEQNEELVAWVLEQARASSATVLELFAGSGNFTRALASVAREVRAVEEDREGAQALERLARASTDARIEVRRSAVDVALERMSAKEERFDVVVLDPPRGGLTRAAAKRVCQLAAQRIVYVSCDPATLSRDLAVMLEGDRFALRDARSFDLMPMTAEVETVVSLVKRG